MALTDVKQVRQATGLSLVDRLRASVTDKLSGEHAKTQRMAGAAFAIRVASAGIRFRLAGVARWIGSHQFGTYVYGLRVFRNEALRGQRQAEVNEVADQQQPGPDVLAAMHTGLE